LAERSPSSSSELPFLSVLQHVTAFQRAIGRLPDAMSRNPDEALLGEWLAGQASALRRKELRDQVKCLLDDALGSSWFRLC
jgi:hypothetical protein